MGSNPTPSATEAQHQLGFFVSGGFERCFCLPARVWSTRVADSACRCDRGEGSNPTPSAPNPGNCAGVLSLRSWDQFMSA